MQKKIKKKARKGDIHKFPLRVDGSTFEAIKKAIGTPGHEDFSLSINQVIVKTLAAKYKSQ